MDNNNLVSYIGKLSGHKYVADLNMLKTRMNGIKEFKYALNFYLVESTKVSDTTTNQHLQHRKVI